MPDPNTHTAANWPPLLYFPAVPATFLLYPLFESFEFRF